MPADNTHHLRDAVARRQRDAHSRAYAALAELREHKLPVNVARLARTAGVARSWIYSQPELLADIRHDHSTVQPSRQAGTAARDESWQQRLELAHGRIRELTAEVQALRSQVARTHGQLRTQRLTGSI